MNLLNQLKPDTTTSEKRKGRSRSSINLGLPNIPNGFSSESIDDNKSITTAVSVYMNQPQSIQNGLNSVGVDSTDSSPVILKQIVDSESNYDVVPVLEPNEDDVVLEPSEEDVKSLWLKPPTSFEVSTGSPFLVDLIEFDENSYAWIRVVELFRSNYEQLKSQLDVYATKRKVVKLDILKPGMSVVCTSSSDSDNNFIYFRAIVVGITLEDKSITVVNIDSRREHIVANRDIFYPCEKVMKLPPLVSQIQINGLLTFVGTDVLQKVKEHITHNNSKFKAQVVTTKPFRMMKLSFAHDNKDVVDVVRQVVPYVTSLPEFSSEDIGFTLKVRVTHVEKGFIWFQKPQCELLTKIVNVWTGFNPKQLMAMLPQFKEVQNHLDNPSSLYLAPYELDYCRAKVTTRINETEVHVHFIDYGNSAVVAIDSLLLLKTVDPNLVCVPPQAMKVKLAEIEIESPPDDDDVWDHLQLDREDEGLSSLIVVNVPTSEKTDPKESEVDFLVLEPEGSRTSLVDILLSRPKNVFETVSDISAQPSCNGEDGLELDQTLTSTVTSPSGSPTATSTPVERNESSTPTNVATGLTMREYLENSEFVEFPSSESHPASTLPKSRAGPDETDNVESRGHSKPTYKRCLSAASKLIIQRKLNEAAKYVPPSRNDMPRKVSHFVCQNSDVEAAVKSVKDDFNESRETRIPTENVKLSGVSFGCSPPLENCKANSDEVPIVTTSTIEEKATLKVTKNEGAEDSGSGHNAAHQTLDTATIRLEQSTRIQEETEEQEWEGNLKCELPDSIREVPIGRKFWAKWLGILPGGHWGFIHVLTQSKWMWWAKLQTLLENFRSDCELGAIPAKYLRCGLYAVASIRNGDKETHIRAQIQNCDTNTDVVEIFDIDSTDTHRVARDRLYPMPKSLTSYPAQAVKVALAGLEIFDGTFLPSMAAKNVMLPEGGVFEAKLIKQDVIPCVSLTNSKRETLTEKLLEQITPLCEVPIPKKKVLTPVLVTHFDSQGYLYYQHPENQDVMAVLKECGDIAAYEQVVRDFKTIVRSQIETPGVVFLAPFSEDGHLYRAVVTEIIDFNQVQVKFIDFGNEETVKIDCMISLTSLDKAVTYIPPQARKAKLENVDKIDPGLCDLFLEDKLNISLRVINNDGECPIVDLIGTTALGNHSLLEFLFRVNSTSLKYDGPNFLRGIEENRLM